MRVGLFGGTFNPIHIGHLIMAQDALEQYELDEVIWIPCHIPSHKSSDSLPALEHRVAMLDLALECDYRMSWSDIEILRGGTSYTIETLHVLQKKRSKDELYFIIGSDSAYDLHLWKSIEEIGTLCTFIVVGRPGFDVDSLSIATTHLPQDMVDSLRNHVAVGHPVGISSSRIRARVAESLSIQYLVPDPVRMYIAEHNLYQS